MTRATHRWFHAANLVVAVSGCVYAWTRYACTPSDPFALVNHPLQPHALHLHVVSAPLLVLMIGIYWQAHAWVRVRTAEGSGRRSGVLILVNALPMAASGVLIQVAVEPRWRTLWIGVHLVTAACWIVGTCAHWGVHRRWGRPGAGSPDG